MKPFTIIFARAPKRRRDKPFAKPDPIATVVVARKAPALAPPPKTTY
jgi:hypothetical protein